MMASETNSYEQIISQSLQESIHVKEKMIKQSIPQIALVARMLVDIFESGKKVVFFGNGGSAADAQHIAGELVNRFNMERPALPALALTTDTSILTSISNDRDFEQIFSRQVEALVQEGDLIVGFSTSGNSKNIINGVVAARNKGALTMGFTGQDGGGLKDLVEMCFCVPSDSTPRIQEAHITVWHAICEAVEIELFKE